MKYMKYLQLAERQFPFIFLNFWKNQTDSPESQKGSV